MQDEIRIWSEQRERVGLMGNALVIITSAHGEGLALRWIIHGNAEGGEERKERERVSRAGEWCAAEAVHRSIRRRMLLQSRFSSVGGLRC